jgi:hypothetical protein
MDALTTKQTTAAEPAKKTNVVRDLILQGIALPEITPKTAKKLASIKAASVQRAIEIALAILGLDGRKLESVQRDWPGIDLAAMMADVAVAARVDKYAEHSAVENYARALQERRVAQKALGILENAIDAEATLGQAQAMLELLGKGREIKEPPKPERKLQFSLGNAIIDDPFGRTSVAVHSHDPETAFLAVCEAMHVRNDAEVAEILRCLRSPMSRVSLGGW